VSTHEEEGEAATELTPSEHEDVDRRMEPRVGVVHETIRREGEHELHRPPSALAWSGLAAGLSMGFSLVAMGVLRAAIPDRPWRHLVVASGYTIGFVVVILGRQQLFTENTLTPVIPLLHNRDGHTMSRLLRLWGIVLLTNLIGAAAFALALARSGAFSREVKEAFAAVGHDALDGGGGEHFVRAIFAGWLIALMVWLLANAESARLAVIVLVSYLVGAARLAHVIAGSVDVLYLVFAGEAAPSAYFWPFLLPTLAGNVLGGIALVAALGHAQTVADAD
jgi:formate/nitrite transporter FocA (FNT family)